MKRFNLMDVQEGVSDLPPWSGPGRMLVHERGLDQRLSARPSSPWVARPGARGAEPPVISPQRVVHS